jgi:phytoene dehydrogenase-like protein
MIVVGAGMSGLSTAVHAAMSGYEVTVFEHHERAGGMCTSWQRDDFTIDLCIHWLMGSGQHGSMRGMYEEIGALDGVELVPLTTFARSVGPHGETFDWAADLDAIVRQVEALSPPDVPLFRELVDAARALRGFETLPADAPELQGPVDWLRGLWRQRRFLPTMYRFMTPLRDAARQVEHPFLRTALENLFLPDMPLVYALVVLAELADGNLARPVGGSGRLPDAVLRKLTALGGTVHFRSEVQEILVTDDRATGVRLANGTVHHADHVISTAPGHTTIFRMLGGRYTDRHIRDRYARWPIFRGIAVASFGVRGRWADLPPILHLQLDRPLDVLGNEVTSLVVRNMSHDPTLAPPGCSVVQVLVDTPFEQWHDLHEAPARYAAAKEELAARVLPAVVPHFPGWDGSALVTDVVTPYSFWQFARTWRGAFEGWLPTMEVVRHAPSKTLPGLRGFHMAGQWVEPGGGIPPAVASGRHAVELACREDGVPFHGSEVGHHRATSHRGVGGLTQAHGAARR